jgi:hypothetical protein
MRRIERYKLLQIFGDGQPHNWFEVINLGVRFLKIHQYDFESLFQQAIIDNGLIVRCSNHNFYKDDDYKITPKGDSCLREEQIARDGDYSYYKHYDRTIDGQYGANHYSPLPIKKNIGGK